MEADGKEQRDEQKEGRLASLIVYTVSLIVICLTAFNIYLLVWIWSSLKDGRQLSLLSSWEEFKIRDDNSEAIKFQSSSRERDNLLELSKDGRCKFGSGLKVRGLSSGQVALVCGFSKSKRSSNDHECLVVNNQDDNERIVRLSNAKGVDFLRKSVQTNKIETKRLHSALNELHLMSLNGSLFHSSNGTIRLSSMEDLIFASKRANVIMEAKTVNLSLVLDKAPDSRGKGYKLCICLEPPKQEENRKISTRVSGTNKGRLFGIKSGLKCENFSRRHCHPV